MKQLNTPIEDSTKNKLDAYVAKHGINKKKVVDLALNEYINRRESKK